MTRFARAKGSKASNERIPERSTPWNEMKEELLKTQDLIKNEKGRKKINKMRQESYDEFVKENKIQEKKEWAKFPTKKGKKITKKNKGKKQKNTVKIDESDEEIDARLNNLKKQIEKTLEMEDNNNSSQSDDEAPEEISAKLKVENTKVNKPARKMKNKKPKKNDQNINEKNIPKEKNKKQEKNIPKEKNKKQEKNIPNGGKKRKLAKVRDNEEHKRRKLNVEKESIMFNGVNQEIVRFDGFPVMKVDYDRLMELRESLKLKGIPESSLRSTMKLERRKAEKLLARLKRMICFNCRGTGHVLSDCPKLNQDLVEDTGTGICYKCGSTEHVSNQCKTKTKSFQFANCFICHQKGHLARECPDNPRGLYPQGGACKLCGDVTHFKKDCPKQQIQKENELFLSIISDGNLESIDDVQNDEEEKKVEKKKKIVKF